MIALTLTYACTALGALAVLSTMILRIGRLIGSCPRTAARARVAATAVATGFAAIGAGGVILIAALLPLLPGQPLLALLLALGFAALCLGLGFTHAVGTLQAVIARAPADPAA